MNKVRTIKLSLLLNLKVYVIQYGEVNDKCTFNINYTASRIGTGTPDYYNSENAQGPHMI